MPRIPRQDLTDTWHHVVNRAIARRTMFERRSDFRFFCAQLAHAVRRREIEVHAYCLMGTHYHLLVRSPSGKLGKAMQRIQLGYSRWFNRSRRRDGSLVRGRYFSKQVRSLEYRRLLVRYIDANPVSARLVTHPAEYPYGSARHYATTGGPPWLERSWIEGFVQSEAEVSTYSPSAYTATFCPLPLMLGDVIKARQNHDAPDEPLDDLVRSSRPAVHAWMIRKAKLADGTSPGLPVLSLQAVKFELDTIQHGTWKLRRGRIQRDAWPVALAGLGRDLCGASVHQLALMLNLTSSTVSKLCSIHRQAIAQQDEYSLRVAAITHAALRSWGTDTAPKPTIPNQV